MHILPIAHITSFSLVDNPTSSPTQLPTQHGHLQSHRLLSIPSESLTHITSFLDPPSLLAVGKSSQKLYSHVKDDNTWCRAFALQYLNIGPENDLSKADSPLLRRTESSWRTEFIARYRQMRRWKRSRNPTITHAPLPSDISSMHLMPDDGLLTASLQYGVVSRSYALSGKVVKGYLDAAGTVNGLGIGNPNAEFDPHVACCVLASDGGTARVLWSTRTGSVSVTIAPRAMDGARVAARFVRCRVEDAHDGAVEDAVWAHGGEFAVTGDSRGRVKVWEVKRMRCVWTSPAKESLVADPCVKVAADLIHGVVVAAMRSGEVIVWSGLAALLQDTTSGSLSSICEIRVPPPFRIASSAVPLNPDQCPSTLFINCRLMQLTIVVHHADDAFFYGLLLDLTSGTVARTRYTGPLASLCSVFPSFSSGESESSFVTVGDQLGHVSVFTLNSVHGSTEQENVAPFRQFEAHTDGAVNALFIDTAVLVTGSTRGTCAVWDALTLAALRSFSSPAPRPAVGGEWDAVKQIAVRDDLLIVVVGSRVMACKAGAVGREKYKTTRKGTGKGRKSNGNVAKWQQKIELSREISDSRAALSDQSTYVRQAFGREKEQLSVLDALGLDEVEAVEYVLMLSRDENEARNVGTGSNLQLPSQDDDGVFDVDLDDGSPRYYSRLSSPASLTPIPSPASSHSVSQRSLSSSWRGSPSSWNSKIQISPRIRPEPTEAGPSTSPLSLSRSSSMAMYVRPPPPLPSTDHFPPMPTTPSPGTSLSVSPAMRRSLPGSLDVPRSSWTKPLQAQASSSGSSPTGASLGARTQAFPTRVASGPSLLSKRLADHARSAAVGITGITADVEPPALDPVNENAIPDDEDAQLRYAIELSLLEASKQTEQSG